MPRLFESSAKAYADIYKPGTELLIKIGGKQIDHASFPAFIEQLQALQAEGLRLIVATGASAQIDRHYKSITGQGREMSGGRGKTDETVLEAARRAAMEIQGKFSQALGADVAFVKPEDILCEIDRDDLGLVGTPRSIAMDTRERMAIVGSLGIAHGQLVNVNTDDSALCIARQNPALYEAFFLTEEGCIRNKEWKPVSLLDEGDMRKIVSGSHESIDAADGMRVKAENIAKMIDVIGKVAVTNIDGLLKEISTWQGSGTLCYRSDLLSHSPLNPSEHDLFRDIHADEVKNGWFRERSPDAVEELLGRAYAVRIKGAPIGFFSLIPHDGEWTELSAISKLLENGVGRRAVASAHTLMAERKGKKLFALSTNPDLVRFFTGCGFTHHGKVSECRDKDGMPPFVRAYDKPDRDPEVYLLNA